MDRLQAEKSDGLEYIKVTKQTGHLRGVIRVKSGTMSKFLTIPLWMSHSTIPI